MTLRMNAAFSLLSGLDFILFDHALVGLITGDRSQSILPVGLMLIGFAVFVFSVSMMANVNKYLVGTIIAMDLLWVMGSVALVTAAGDAVTMMGRVLIVLVALVIAGFAYFQTKGLRRYLSVASAS